MRGRRLGIDPGDVRVGLAVSDADGILAGPLKTLINSDTIVAELLDVIREHDIVEVYVGFPLNLKGQWTPSTDKAVSLARALAQEIDIPVRLVDERLTTSSANRVLRDVGRSQRRSRSVIDQIAAVTLLQQALDEMASFNRLPGRDLGEVVAEHDG